MPHKKRRRKISANRAREDTDIHTHTQNGLFACFYT